jgi:hypothetical protein
MDLRTTTPREVETLRQLVIGGPAASLTEAAQALATNLATAFPAVVLSRVFAVLPFEMLPAPAAAFARRLAGDDNPIGPGTPILSLLGTHGRQPAWCDRHMSQGHLAIPLVSARFVGNIPMVSSLLASLGFDLTHLDARGGAFTRRMEGRLNGAFYVPDAQTAKDDLGRPIIAPDFAREHGVRTVFGMGGPYFDRTFLAIISFTDVVVERAVIDHFATLISFFKMSTQDLVRTGRIFA